jgi:hypothetical protein
MGLYAVAAQAREAYLIANDHFRGQAALNALDLHRRVTRAPVNVPPQLLAVHPELERLMQVDTSSTLFVPQRLNRIEAGGLARRIEPEEDPNGGGEGNRQEDRIRRDDGRPVGQR